MGVYILLGQKNNRIYMYNPDLISPVNQLNLLYGGRICKEISRVSDGVRSWICIHRFRATDKYVLKSFSIDEELCTGEFDLSDEVLDYIEEKEFNSLGLLMIYMNRNYSELIHRFTSPSSAGVPL